MSLGFPSRGAMARFGLWFFFALLALLLEGLVRYLLTGAQISDRRTETITLPGGEILWSESFVRRYGICFRDCLHEGERISTLYIQLAAGEARERVAELRSSPAGAACCLLRDAKPLYLKRARDVAVLVFGKQIVTRWGLTAMPSQAWLSWSISHDQETGYFLRHFGCASVNSRAEGLPPCVFPEGMPYNEVSVDLDERIVEIRDTKPRLGWPGVLVYSAPSDGWMFDLDRTLRANRGL